MTGREEKKLSCSNCRKIKRRCDGAHPCASCKRRNVTCEYNQTDRRSQRFSVGYIKSLETNNEFLEATLAQLVELRDDPEQLSERLSSLQLAFPSQSSEASSDKLQQLTEAKHPESAIADIKIPAKDPAEKVHYTEDNQYFGPGSVFPCSNQTRTTKEPLLNDQTKPISEIVTIEQDYDYVANLVRGCFDSIYLPAFQFLFNRKQLLEDLDNRNLDGKFLSEELMYAICCNSEEITWGEAAVYCDLVLQNLFRKNVSSSIAVSQCYSLLAIHCISRGQISKGWIFSGLAIRVGMDVGFDTTQPGKEICPTTNRCFMGTLIVDTYISMSVGRRPSLSQNSIPVLRLEGESEDDYLQMKACIDIVEMTRDMVRTTYSPIAYSPDPKVNFLYKFNRTKSFNVKLSKWKQNLPPACSWSYTTMKASKNLGKENHFLKVLYYYLIIFLNKPFLHVPKQQSTVYLMEEVSKEMLLIVHSQLELLDKEHGQKTNFAEVPKLEPFKDSDINHPVSLAVCVVTLLTYVLYALITMNPEQYIYLSRHFKAFVRYLNYIKLRKYGTRVNHISVLVERFAEFRAKYVDGMPDGDSPVDQSSENRSSKLSVSDSDDMDLHKLSPEPFDIFDDTVENKMKKEEVVSNAMNDSLPIHNVFPSFGDDFLTSFEQNNFSQPPPSNNGAMETANGQQSLQHLDFGAAVYANLPADFLEDTEAFYLTPPKPSSNSFAPPLQTGLHLEAHLDPQSRGGNEVDQMMNNIYSTPGYSFNANDVNAKVWEDLMGGMSSQRPPQ